MEIQEKILVSKSLVESFSEISGDKNPIHLDENYAKNTHFRHTIAPGILLVSFFSKIIANTYLISKHQVNICIIILKTNVLIIYNLLEP